MPVISFIQATDVSKLKHHFQFTKGFRSLSSLLDNKVRKECSLGIFR